jgi:cytochrome oxidase assembly protein ShyY1
VLRTALKPRWLGLLVVLVVILVTFTQLGLWQLNVARDKGRAEAVEQAPSLAVAPLGQVIAPHTSFPSAASGRRVEVTGTYAAGGQFLVGGRVLDGRDGYWVVAPLIERDTEARLAVVRGFVRERSQAAGPPLGRVVVTGSLAPGESPAEAPAEPGSAAYPQGVLGSIDLAVLVNRWPGELYNAFAFATAERSAGGAAVGLTPGLERVPPPVAGGTSLNWRNAAYALQWWIFAVFAAYMWWRMVRDDTDRDRAAALAEEQESTA